MVRREEIEILDQKASEDLRGAEVLLKYDDELLTLAGFHLQQFLEKKMKVSLQKHYVKYPKTHDLSALLDLFPQNKISEADDEFVQILSQYAVELRYGMCTDPPWSGQQMLEKVKNLRSALSPFGIVHERNVLGRILLINETLTELIDDVVRDAEERTTIIMIAAVLLRGQRNRQSKEQGVGTQKGILNVAQSRCSLDEPALQTNDFVPDTLGEMCNQDKYENHLLIKRCANVRD